ncbi:hypothetical protein CLOBOL_01868 [Enterocloster bolteae ATCC BAA-613]|jgi:hypothetical protein|uniref:Glycine/sarcosine/betaine reductase complex component A n=1 Tax=Enterocloster bolteae (strain ATCC BAA-613 / DSM 15670 / CCUG 46953 / JCM 12243 / WAL 16351) TaxID=411902 RepID=A8RMC2_ENTBW|nr:hypothetical protein CLOBOL_01868 [Enterocloster bolteae ATCC BAA-613]
MAPGQYPAAKSNTKNKIRRKTDMAILKDKKVIIIGDRDGIPGPAIEECVKTAGAEVVYSSTECFV